MPVKKKDILTIYCNCSYYDFIPEDTRNKVLQALTDSGIEFEAVPDLCLLAARRDPILQKWAKADNIRIVACFPRAIRWLFKAGGTQLPERDVKIFNMRTNSPEDIITGLPVSSGCEKESTKPVFEKDSAWVPWFPVIDYDRCRNCRQCQNFCLFGVYGSSPEDKVEVQNPMNCKTNCPACARVCPHKAIIFPKYSDSPINGDEITEQSAIENKTPQLSEALQGNVYDTIRQRNKDKKRFSVNSEEKASAGTRPSLYELQKELKIPNEVLASLSPAEIMKIRAKSRKDNSQEIQPVQISDNIKKER